MATTLPITSRGALGWLAAVLAGMLSAATFALALVFTASPLAIFAYLSPAPLLFVGLGAGSFSALAATLLGTGALFAAFQSSSVLLSYIVFVGLPVTTLVALAMLYRQDADGTVYWYPEGYLLTALAVYPCLVFLLLGIATSLQGDDLLSLSREFLQNHAAELSAGVKPEDMPRFNEALQDVAQNLPMISGGIWMLLIFMGALASQYSLKQQNWMLRSPLRFHTLHLPNWLIGALGAAALCGVLGAKPLDYYGMNISLLLCVPFFFLGLTVIHALTATVRWRRTTLAFFYLFIMAAPKVPVLVFLAVLGVLDQGLNLRQRLAQQPKRI